MFKAPGLER
jgi:hypothetical protein